MLTLSMLVIFYISFLFVWIVNVYGQFFPVFKCWPVNYKFVTGSLVRQKRLHNLGFSCSLTHTLCTKILVHFYIILTIYKWTRLLVSTVKITVCLLFNQVFTKITKPPHLTFDNSRFKLYEAGCIRIEIRMMTVYGSRFGWWQYTDPDTDGDSIRIQIRMVTVYGSRSGYWQHPDPDSDDDRIQIQIRMMTKSWPRSGWCQDPDPDLDTDRIRINYEDSFPGNPSHFLVASIHFRLSAHIHSWYIKSVELRIRSLKLTGSYLCRIGICLRVNNRVR